MPSRFVLKSMNAIHKSLLTVSFGKVGWEQWQGASQDIVTLIDAEVATDAHLYGAVIGLLLYAVSLFVRRFTEAGEQTATG